ncbi:MAG: trypsin-like peptidase domain-containing protein [Rhodoferax sp.]|nr:trypsin-like peptidase domain-containing protein [Rhodoferax sp.]
MNQRKQQHTDGEFSLPGNFVVLVLIFSLAGSTRASADSLTEAMRSSTVPVVCLVSSINVGTGSGFLVADGKHLVTNRHVIACTDEGGKAGIMAANGELVQAAVIWQSAAKDLAVLRVETNPGGQAVSFATRSAMDERDRVIVAGYPGAALRSIRDFGRVSFAEGIISKFTELDSPEGTVRHIQITAPVNPGNSGGPLFNELGLVVGINVQKSMTAVLVVDPAAPQGLRQQRVPLGEGVAWAILSDELLVELERLHLPFKAARSKPNAFTAEFGRQPVLFTLLGLTMGLTMLAVGLLVNPRRRVMLKDALTRRRGLVTGHVANPAKAAQTPVLRGITGPYANTNVPLDNEKIAIGRDASLCQLVLPADAANIGRRHCTVRWDQATAAFWLEDCWTGNGTFLDNGERIDSGQPHRLKPGDRFYLANRHCQFEVALETTP